MSAPRAVPYMLIVTDHRGKQYVVRGRRALMINALVNRFAARIDERLTGRMSFTYDGASVKGEHGQFEGCEVPEDWAAVVGAAQKTAPDPD